MERFIPINKLVLQPSTSQSNENNQTDRECVSCHLCAIEVPTRFIKEHYESDKHKINTKIADVALQRVQKLLHHNIVSDIDKTESLYFCPQCVISLNLKDRQSHEKTVVHKKALTVDKFLYDFYVLYSNDDANPDLAEECEATVAEKSNDVEQINAIDNISLNIEKNQLMNSEKVEVKTGDSSRNTENVINSNQLIYEAISNSNVIKIDKQPDNPVTNEVTDTTPFDNTQFCTFGSNKNQVYCKACKVYVPNNSSNKMSHQKGFKHKEILRQLKNNH